MLLRSPNRAAAILALVLSLFSRLVLAADYDVVVVGGGPAGLAAAIEARQNGAARVLVVEKRSDERKRVQVLNLRRRTVDNLARLGVDLRPGENITALQQRSGKNLVTGTSTHHRVAPLTIDPARATHRVGDMLVRDSAQAAVMHTNALEEELIRAARRAGVEMIFDQAADDFGTDGADAWTQVGTRRISSELVVVADGAHSTAAQKLGLRRLGYQGRATRIVGTVFAQPGQSEIVAIKVPASKVQAVGISKMGAFDSSGLLAEVPPEVALPDDAARQAFAAETAAQVGVHGPFLLPPSEFTVALTHAEKVAVADRFFLIGDAARTTHVFTGLGVNWALRDAARFGAMVARYKKAADPGERRRAVRWFAKETMQATYRLHRRAWSVFDNLQPAGSPAKPAIPTLKQLRTTAIAVR